MSKITKQKVDALVCPDGSPVYLWDSGLAGFGVKALPTGKKRFVLKYRTHGGGRSAPQRWLTLGTFGQITVDQARSMAQAALAAVAQGNDPQAEKFHRRAAPTMRELWNRFEAEQLPLKKPSTQDEYRRQWNDVIAKKFGQLRVEEIGRSDIDRFHKSLHATPYRANRILALLARLMTLAERWEWRQQGTNPCRYIERFKEESRERYLDAKEIRHLSIACDALQARGEIWSEHSNLLKLLLLTGARLNELVTAQWAWVDWNRRILALPDSKTGRKPVYLNPLAVRLLRSQRRTTRDQESVFIFPGRSKGMPIHNIRKPWAKICKEAGVTNARIHDLRHTAASIAVGQGVSLAVIGGLLGHSQAQTTLRYAHLASDPAHAASRKLGAFLLSTLK